MWCSWWKKIPCNFFRFRIFLYLCSCKICFLRRSSLYIWIIKRCHCELFPVVLIGWRIVGMPLCMFPFASFWLLRYERLVSPDRWISNSKLSWLCWSGCRFQKAQKSLLRFLWRLKVWLKIATRKIWHLRLVVELSLSSAFVASIWDLLHYCFALKNPIIQLNDMCLLFNSNMTIDVLLLFQKNTNNPVPTA